MKEKKIYILDTNVLVYDAQAMMNFAKSQVGIPFIVLEELDRLKTEGSLRGANAREAIRYLDLLRERGDLKEGVALDNGGTLRVLFAPEEAVLPSELASDMPDNKILSTARSLKQDGYEVRLISKDLNMRVKADALGIAAVDYTQDTVSHEELYKGWMTVLVSAHELKNATPENVHELVVDHQLIPNEFIIIQSRHNIHLYKIFRYVGHKEFKEVVQPPLSFPLEARNPQQLMALDLLFDNAVPLVTLIGPAGTGKTFLTLLAGLEKVIFSDEYEKILISRPVIPLGPDIGYLPGDIREKLLSWMQPIYDNMELILHSAQTARMKGKSAAIYRGYEEKRKGKRYRRDEKHLTVDNLIESGKISLEAITYMRGRSIPYQFILIDEVQNLTPHEVKTLISRVGEGSKIILAGDPYQIDSPYLDFSSNGLVVASNRFKGQQLFGTVYLETSERSALSKLATELM